MWPPLLSLSTFFTRTKSEGKRNSIQTDQALCLFSKQERERERERDVASSRHKLRTLGHPGSWLLEDGGCYLGAEKTNLRFLCIKVHQSRCSCLLYMPGSGSNKSHSFWAGLPRQVKGQEQMRQEVFFSCHQMSGPSPRLSSAVVYPQIKQSKSNPPWYLIFYSSPCYCV